MGHVNVPEGLKEIIQQNNEKAYPQIIMEQASYPYLFHLSDTTVTPTTSYNLWYARNSPPT